MTNKQGEVVRELLRALPGLTVVDDEAAVAEKSHDTWMRSLLERRMGVEEHAGAVVRPKNKAEVSEVLVWAEASETAVVPFGLGSGVCGAVLAGRDQIVIDMGSMDRIVEVNENSLTVTVEAGMRGSTFEAELERRGYTMGHFPQSIELSTVGGWCATRASGQHSTLYGNIEDMLLGCEVVLAGGRIVRLPAVPRSATGPDLRHLFLGSEGTLGIFTELTFRIHPKPEARKGCAYSFTDLGQGVEVIREALRVGWTPSVTRLYDAREAGRNFAGVASEGESVLLLLSEGPAAKVEAEQSALQGLAKARAGKSHGGAPVESWLEHRNDVPSFESLLDQGLVVDTIEIAAAWENLVPL